ncbi:MAG: sigma 54-interacting transcriptional regulator [bacterium]
MAVILVVDDEKSILDVLKILLQSQGHDVIVAQNGTRALEVLAEKHVDLLLSDVRMVPMDGHDLRKNAKALYPAMPVVLMTGFRNIGIELANMNLGVFDYIIKPILMEDLFDIVEHWLNASYPPASEKDVVLPAQMSYRFGTIIAESPEMQHVCRNIELAAGLSTPTLLCGEAGTGKSLIAKAIHDCSSRKNGSFVALNCAKMSETVISDRLFGTADGSLHSDTPAVVGQECTIFLDEVTMMTPWLLTQLVIRLAKSGEVKNGSEPLPACGVILAANSTLESLSRLGGFELLIEQICGTRIELKPLRESNADILPLLSHFFYKATGDWNGNPVLASEVYVALLRHTWPQNRSELSDLASHLLGKVTDGRITMDMLPQDIAAAYGKGSHTTAAGLRFIARRSKSLQKLVRSAQYSQ